MRVYKYTLLVLLTLLILSCAATKDSRRIKDGSGVIQTSKVLLIASAEGAIGFLSFRLRSNNFFDIDEGAMFGWDYYAGTWTMTNDTIKLSYVDGHKREDFLNFVYIDKEGKDLIIPRGDSLPAMRLPISYDNLKTR